MLVHIPHWAVRVVEIGAPIAIVLAAGVALATPKKFSAGQTLTDTDLNFNFSDLDSRLSVVEGAIPVMTAWATYSVALTDGPAGPTVPVAIDNQSSSTGYWRRVGDSVEVRIEVRVPKCQSFNDALYFSLPPGLTIDTAKIPFYTTVGNSMVGKGPAQITNPTVLAPLPNALDKVVLQTQTSGVAVGCSDVGDGGWTRFQYSVPIQGWSVTK